MLKSTKAFFNSRKEKYKVPKRVQNLIPINEIWIDGIFRNGTSYSKTFKFTDMNYCVATDKNKMDMLDKYCNVIKSIDSDASAQILVFNRKSRRKDLFENVYIKDSDDGKNKYRHEYNGMIAEKAKKGTNHIKERYMTVTTVKKNIEEARAYFKSLFPELQKNFLEINSKCEELTAIERLHILHRIYRPIEREEFSFDINSTLVRGHDFRDYVCPDSMEKHSDYLKIGDSFARVLFLKECALYLTDTFVDEIVSRNTDIMFSVNYIPVPKEETLKILDDILLGINTNITNWQQRQNENRNFSADVPYQYREQKEAVEEIIKEIKDGQKLTQSVVTVVITAKSKEELDRETSAIKSYASSKSSQLATLTFQQMDGLNTSLPIGAWQLNIFRTLLTNSVASIVPFKIMEIQDENGLYYGENAVSHNLILCDKSKLLNQSSFVLGVPGCGKSFFVKMLIAIILLATKDSVLIYDPEGEYVELVKALVGNDCSIVDLHAGGKDRLNAMSMVDGYGDGNPISSKTDFIVSVIERISGREITPEKKSIIDRCVAKLHHEQKKNGAVPTLSLLREELLRQPEQQARDIALSIEMYTEGSQELFGHESNVDLTKRVLVFDTHRLGSELKAPGMLIITDTILNRVIQNHARGIRTHIFIDEFHTAFCNDAAAEFLDSAWRQFRKRGGQPTAITQNVRFLLDYPKARDMLSNSEFITMLSQSEMDRADLAELFNISGTQLKYITNAKPGTGLIKYGPAIIPFENHFPEDTKLYELMTTKPGEGVFGQVQNKNMS